MMRDQKEKLLVRHTVKPKLEKGTIGSGCKNIIIPSKNGMINIKHTAECGKKLQLEELLQKSTVTREG